MNDRIKELAEDAGFNPVNYMGSNSILFQKFAELIIYECLSICEELGDKGMDGHYCADKILKYFGVNQ
jgi:hypothetical protein